MTDGPEKTDVGQLTNRFCMQQETFYFSVITLNLRFGLAKDGINGWEYRKKGYAPFFKDYPADFYGFQEANDFQTCFIDEILSDYGYIGKRTPAPQFWQNNIIFFHSSWECIHQSHLFLSPTPTIPSRFADSQWPRQCTIGVFKKSGSTIACLNTHFDFLSSVQEKSARIILNAMPSLPANTPVILLGDFNAEPSSPCHQVFTNSDGQADQPFAAFQNAFQAPFPGSFHDFTGEKDGRHIDWILYRGEMAPVESKVIRGKYTGQYLSDHFPLFAEFKFT
jgi:endonuclease/exonuclease/phosphatase family metal-dependent hydrolase